MTTAAPPSPFAEHDRQLREQYRRRNAGQQWLYLDGLSDRQLREKLTLVEVAERELANIDSIIAETNAKIDEAVAEHQRVTGPLQATLATPLTPIDRKVSLRAQVIAANENLESTTSDLRKTIEAAEAEREVIRATAAGRVSLENAWCNAAPAADRERKRALEKAIELAETGLLFALRRKVADAELEFDNARRKQRALHDQNPKRYSLTNSLVDDHERNVAYLRAVASIMSGWVRQAHDELKAIRAKRLSQLYDE